MMSEDENDDAHLGSAMALAARNALRPETVECSDMGTHEARIKKASDLLAAYERLLATAKSALLFAEDRPYIHKMSAAVEEIERLKHA